MHVYVCAPPPPHSLWLCLLLRLLKRARVWMQLARGQSGQAPIFLRSTKKWLPSPGKRCRASSMLFAWSDLAHFLSRLRASASKSWFRRSPVTAIGMVKSIALVGGALPQWNRREEKQKERKGKEGCEKVCACASEQIQKKREG